jgi:hypothetical protein
MSHVVLLSRAIETALACCVFIQTRAVSLCFACIEPAMLYIIFL